MASIINASSSGSGGIVQTADASGVLQLQSNGTVAINILSGTSIAVGSATAYNGGGFGSNMSIYGAGSASVTVVNSNEQFQIGANTANNLGFYNPTHSTYMAAMNQYGIGVGSAVPSSGFGITFPSTQSPSSNSNTLDDYEEGSWTPTDASGAGLTFSSAYGYYIKVGKVVYVQAKIIFPSTGSSANNLLGGLPFGMNNSSPYNFPVQSCAANGNTSALRAYGYSSNFVFLNTSDATSTNASLSGANINFNLTYIADQ